MMSLMKLRKKLEHHNCNYIYQLLWKKSKALKALVLLISIIIVVAPLYLIDFFNVIY